MKQLNVTGLLGDGMTIDLTTALAGTTYNSMSPGTAAVTADGMLIGLQEGLSTIETANGGFSDQLLATVLSF